MNMRKIQVVGIALFAMLAFGVIAATSASAAEWLAGGLSFNGELATNTEGTLTLLVLTSGGVELNAIECSGLFEGDVGGTGALEKEVDLVLDLLSLTAGTLIGELTGTSLDCLTVSNFMGLGCLADGETGTIETLLWVDELSLALGLTWESLLELMAAGAEEFLVHFHHVAFELLCFAGSTDTNVEFLCEGLTSAVVDNEPTDVLLLFNAASEALTCPTGPEPGITIDLEGSLLSTLTNGLVLAASV